MGLAEQTGFFYECKLLLWVSVVDGLYHLINVAVPTHYNAHHAMLVCLSVNIYSKYSNVRRRSECVQFEIPCYVSARVVCLVCTK